MATRAREFNPDFITLLRDHLPMHEPVTTLGVGRPNWIVGIEAGGVHVETDRTRSSGTGPQHVPAWMIVVAWERLTSRGRLTNAELLATNDLNVKRSSFVCATLAWLPGVQVASRRPIVLTYAPV